jgi:glycosyltransferase involved in cell wall biosynthesis
MSADTLRLLADDDLRQAYGSKGRAQAIERYSASKIIPQYIAFYEKVLAKPRSAAA